MNLNPLDLPGPAFLAFYAFALIAAHLVGKALVHRCSSRHRTDAPLPDSMAPLELAVLSGGRARAVETALVRLLFNGWIAVGPGGNSFVATPTTPPPLEDLQSDVYREVSRKQSAIDDLRRISSTFLSRAEARLTREGLLLVRGSSEANCVQMARCLPFAAVIAFGCVKVFIGMARHRPVAFLVVFLIASVVILGFKYFKLPLRSAQGQRTLEFFERRHAALKTTVRRRSSDVDDGTLLFVVALFGPQVLASTDLAWMHESFATRSSSSSDSGSSSGGCGGGGGGGGGCGGCGG